MRTMMIILPFALAAAACTGDPSSIDAASVGTDGRPAVDASATDGADARPAVTVDVACQPYTRTTTNSNGTRTVVTTYYGVVASIGPEDDFAVMTCGPTYSSPPESCPTGATCEGTNTPSGTTCYRAYRNGQFTDGKLTVSCGHTMEFFAADGTRTGNSSLTYTSIRVTTY